VTGTPIIGAGQGGVKRTAGGGQRCGARAGRASRRNGRGRSALRRRRQTNG